MTLELLAERTAPPLRGRLVACPCDLTGCTEVVVLVQLVGTREDLWMAMGAAVGLDEAAERLDDVLDHPMREAGNGKVREMIEHGLALIGMTWEELSRGDTMDDQIQAWVNIPEWMERLPAGLVWATRRVTFGEQLTRVVRALEAADYYYVPDMDVMGVGERAGPLGQPWAWGVRDHPLAETLARPEHWKGG